MTISYDPRAMEAKRKAAELEAARQPGRMERSRRVRIWTAAYCFAVIFVSFAAALVAAVATGV